MSKLVNSVSVRPDELNSGNVMAVTVTLHVQRTAHGLVFRMYRCGYPPQTHDGIPQGSRIGPPEQEQVVMETLFPVVGWAGGEADV